MLLHNTVVLWLRRLIPMLENTFFSASCVQYHPIKLGREVWFSGKVFVWHVLYEAHEFLSELQSPLQKIIGMIIPDDFVLLSSRLWLALKMQLVKGLKPQTCRGVVNSTTLLLNQCRIFGESFVLGSLHDVPLSNGTDKESGESNFDLVTFSPSFCLSNCTVTI